MTDSMFPRLFTPGKIGGMEIKNRIVMPPMGSAYAASDGQVSDLLVDHYEQRARGGVGLVIVEFTCVYSPWGVLRPEEPLIDDDRFIPGLSRLVQAIKKHGARAAIQLAHPGREAHSKYTGSQPVAPSPIATPWGEKPRELSSDEVKEMVNRFAQAAVRARKAGFEGVEIHGAHGYLIAEFLSPLANKRQDEYGGSIQNRSRFLAEVIQAVRAELGRDFPVWCRLNGMEAGEEGGLKLAEAEQVARIAEGAGADAMSISAFGFGKEATVNMPDVPGSLLPLAEAIKKAVKVPVIAVGRITPEAGEKALKEGRADFIAMGRQLIADPELPRKAAAGRAGDVVPCIGCLTCIDGLMFREKTITCSVNATAGRKPGDVGIRPAHVTKRVVVVGGGPAGMEAARVAAIRGHRVTLCEKEDILGGQMLLAALPPHKQNIRDDTLYLIGQMEKLKVEVRTGNEINAGAVQKMRPDAVVVATGIAPVYPDIPGLDKRRTVLASDVLAGSAAVGKEVVVVGGGMVGCEVADFLSEKGKHITVVEMLPRLAADMVALLRSQLLSRLRTNGVSTFAGANVREISDGGLTLVDAKGKQQAVHADTIIIACGGKPRRELYDALTGAIPEVHLAGDALKPGTIQEAVARGFDISAAL